MNRLMRALVPAAIAVNLLLAVNNVGANEAKAVVEGTVVYVSPLAKTGATLTLASGTNRFFVDVLDAAGHAPVLASRVEVTYGQPASNSAGTPKMTVSGYDQIQFLSGTLIPLITRVSELQRLAVWPEGSCVVHLAGQVMATSPGKKVFALRDDSGVALLEFNSRAEPLAPGENIALEGNCLVRDGRIRLSDPPVVVNNDIHTMMEESGTIFLTAGKHPIQLDWFNHEFPYGLEVYIQGPDLPRQLISDAMLFRREMDRTNGVNRWVNGLDYRCYEGNWLRVPDYNRLIPTKTGTTTNFDLSVITRVNDVGLQFTGYVEVPRDGIYQFTTRSDDGSLMFVDENPLLIERLGSNAIPDPVFITAGQGLPGDQDDRWSQVEGTVTFASEQSGDLHLELSSSAGHIRVDVMDSFGASPEVLLNSRVRVTGICLATSTADGASVAGRMSTPGMDQIQVLDLPTELWDEYAVTPIGRLAEVKAAPGGEAFYRVRGRIHSLPTGGFVVSDETGSASLAMTQSPPQNADTPVDMLGALSRDGSNIVLRCAGYRELANQPHPESAALPLLTTVEQIKRLSRSEWQRGYPVKIRGVITTVLDSGFFIQDATRSIYARWRAPTDNDVPQVGDFWEIEGRTFAEFAPNIQVTKASRLGSGTLPAPLHPTWDQLINGSLDTEYIEAQGIVSAVETDGVTLLTRAGKIKLLLPDVPQQELRRYENSLIRVRGCVMPVRDIRTQQVVPGQMRLANASITVDEVPPGDPFAITLKHASDLLLFDLQAGAFQRVRIAGQILHVRDGQLFLLDSGMGLRAIPKSVDALAVGDQVEVVGFPDLSESSPVLREALVRRTGHAPLPPPALLPSNALLNRKYDATFVRVEARLAALSNDQSDYILELQSGAGAFVARIKMGNGSLPAILPGSQLELSGVYVGQGNDLLSGHNFDSFELLLNSTADVRVLARPSWWTARHALEVFGSMAAIIFVGLVWIAVLRRQVEERSNQLAAEIRRHELTERQRELEQERTRIARDLHDDLGASLTQIRFLSALESRDAQLPEATRHRMVQVSEKSREMVASLDEIVWAVNPANDSVPILANYFCHFADEFFRLTRISCRLDVDDALPPVQLTSEVRHNLYLAVREALNNIVKHSQATEVWLRIRCQPPETLGIVIEDNGQGLSAPTTGPAGNGLLNMRQRLETIGGSFDCQNRPGGGLVCRFLLPLRDKPSVKHEA